MSFCNEEQLEQFLINCPKFENLIIDSGIILIKYWFGVSQEEQEKRLQARNNDVTKRWKLGKIDVAARQKWDEYTIARDEMFLKCDTEKSPWFVVEADEKEHARLNCIHHLLSQFDYTDNIRDKVDLVEVPKKEYESNSYSNRKFVPDVAGHLAAQKNKKK